MSETTTIQDACRGLPAGLVTMCQQGTEPAAEELTRRKRARDVNSMTSQNSFRDIRREEPLNISSFDTSVVRSSVGRNFPH